MSFTGPSRQRQRCPETEECDHHSFWTALDFYLSPVNKARFIPVYTQCNKNPASAGLIAWRPVLRARQRIFEELHTSKAFCGGTNEKAYWGLN
jgi:hypothetical protein